MPEWGATLITVSWVFLGLMSVFMLSMVGSVFYDRYVRGNKDAFKTDPRYLTHRRKHDDPLPRH